MLLASKVFIDALSFNINIIKAYYNKTHDYKDIDI